MSMTRDQLYQAALELAEVERLELAGQLMETVPPSSTLWNVEDEEFLDELDRRADDPSPRITWSQVRAELHDL